MTIQSILTNGNIITIFFNNHGQINKEIMSSFNIRRETYIFSHIEYTWNDQGYLSSISKYQSNDTGYFFIDNSTWNGLSDKQKEKLKSELESCLYSIKKYSIFDHFKVFRKNPF